MNVVSARPDQWVLFDRGTGGAHDLIVITQTAARELHAFNFWPEPATEAHGFVGAYLAPRWLLDFVGAVIAQVFHARPFGGSEADRAEVDKLVTAAERVVHRGLDDPKWASALLVVLQTGGLLAAAAFARDSIPPPA